MKSARFTLYTMHTGRHTQLHTHTHKSDIHEIIFFEASVELNDNEILSTCFYVYYAKLLYLSHLPAPPVYFFLIYQIQFLFHCVIVAAKPKIFSEKFRSLSFQQNPESHLFYSVFQPPHPWWTAANKRCKWHYIESRLFKTSFGLHPFDDPVMDTFGFFPHGKKLFLFLKHQSSLNKTTVLSQESNNNFLYIWQTGFCIFFLILFYDPKSTLFPRTWAFVALFVSVSLSKSVSGLPNGRSFCSNNPDPLINLLCDYFYQRWPRLFKKL